MVDKSWGVPGATGFRVRSNLSPADRAAERARAREERVRERAGAVTAMMEERAAARAQDAVAREAARVARREREEQASAGDPHAAAAKRHRSSGRKDVVREQRDTRGYTTVVDVERLRALAERGTSIAGLAGAFGISQEEVEAALAAK
ncbi:hypothetical protein [Sphingomonas rubra]|uniref:Uncharacterized protein n=1 Tax=Sphingomonas rubra TaxID=634430 RepID=A0A1I5RAK6_9SPHN|nr:hypothetical protein [Sphingomonas rubra]SFP55533.1 hypothetical protein SAMN04488241_103122 [Sphingomonas rubra]